MTDLLPVEPRLVPSEPAPPTDLVAAAAAELVADRSVVINRAVQWLREAQRIEDVRDEKAFVVSVEAYVRERELGADAQLAATQIVRRCERKIGQLVRIGQQRGEILSQGQTMAKLVSTHGGELRRVHEAIGVAATDRKATADTYAMADVSDGVFERAIAEARDEGNLSRANVVRKVKGAPSPQGDRSEWHYKTRRIDSTRILRETALNLRAAVSGLDLCNADDIDPDERDEWVESIRESMRLLGAFVRRVAK